MPLLWISTRWYLHRAPAGYLREMAAYSAMNASLAETVDGGRTVESMRLQRNRRRRCDDDIAESFAAERYTLWLRTVWFPTAETVVRRAAGRGACWSVASCTRTTCLARRR